MIASLLSVALSLRVAESSPLPASLRCVPTTGGGISCGTLPSRRLQDFNPCESVNGACFKMDVSAKAKECCALEPKKFPSVMDPDACDCIGPGAPGNPETQGDLDGMCAMVEWLPCYFTSMAECCTKSPPMMMFPDPSAGTCQCVPDQSPSPAPSQSMIDQSCEVDYPSCATDQKSRFDDCCAQNPKQMPTTRNDGSGWVCDCMGPFGDHTDQDYIDRMCDEPASRPPACLNTMAIECCSKSPKQTVTSTKSGGGDEWTCSCEGTAPSESEGTAPSETTGMTCLDVKQAYKDSKCCGNPQKTFDSKSLGRRLIVNEEMDDSESVLTHVRKALQQAKKRGANEAQQLAKNIKIVLDRAVN